MRKLTMAMATVVALGVATEAMGQDAQITGTASVTIPQVLSFRTGTAAQLTIVLNAAAFDASGVGQGTGSVSIPTMGNVPHAVEVSSTALTNQGGEGELTLQVMDPDGDYVDLNGSQIRAVEGLARGLQTALVNFQVTANVADHDPGSYTGTITYTLVADN